jgi:hypothetical protein
MQSCIADDKSQPDMECEPSNLVDEMENNITATAQPLVSSISMPDAKDQHELFSFNARVADTMYTSTPIADPQKHTIHVHPLDDDSGIEHSAVELTDAEGPVREEELAHILPTMPHGAHIPTNTQASPVKAIWPDSVAAGQSHAEVPQFLLQEEGGGYQVQDDAQYDVDSAYDADSIRNDDTETLASFITNYRWENGRRYHAYSDGAYWVRP